MKCEYGCGQEAKYQFRNGKWCCSSNVSKCQNIRDVIKRKREGQIVSIETRRKQSEAKKGKISWRKGKSYIELYGKKKADKLKKLCKERNIGKVKCKTIRLKISKSLKENGWYGYWEGKKRPDHSEQMKGENHPFFGRYGEESSNWKGGISFEPYCEIWSDQDYKQSIKERDGNKCLNPYCFKTSENLVIHHVDYNKKNCHPGNLITICDSCNGRANKDREWHQLWYKAILFRQARIK